MSFNWLHLIETRFDRMVGRGKTGMLPQAQTLLDDLDTTLAKVSPSRRSQMLRQMTDLLMAAPYSEELVAIFGAVMTRLAENAELGALIEVSGRLVAHDDAPPDVVARLAQVDDIVVSGPLLEKSEVLSDGDLVGIATTKSQPHLLAIAGRKRIADIVTDVLVDRGNAAVKHKVTANEGAAISERGFARLITEAGGDKRLAALVAKRSDVPAELQPFLNVATGE